METGYLAIILHAHLPYVRHPEHEESLEENWLYEAITETYVPLFLVLENLIEDGIDFRLTFSLTPSLASMLMDPLLQSRYVKRMEGLIGLTEREIHRTRLQPQLQPLARMYDKLFRKAHDTFQQRYDGNLAQAFRRFQELGKVEVIASAATHGYLPLLSVNEQAVRTQIRVGVEHYEGLFGRMPKGFWLPECGYYPGVDRLLKEQGIRYTILETHGITRASQRPRHGVYAPLYCPSGLAVFGRDPSSSRQVWSSIEGYPGDYDYREFYRDIGHELDLEYIRQYIHRDGIRVDTGMKYYRITGHGEYKEPYVPEWGERKAERHAEHFLSERIKQVEQLRPAMGRKPIIVAPYDSELFGHWWFEGPRWLDYLIRKIALEQRRIRLATLSEYLEEYPTNQTATPSMSSWGHNGFNEVWLNGQNDWIYPHLHLAADLMQKLGAKHSGADGLTLRALNQATRELLLAQSSDWAFMINSGAMDNYATSRTKNHLLRLYRLSHQIENQDIDEAWLRRLESQDNLFLDIATAAEFMGREDGRKRAAEHPRLPESKVDLRSGTGIATPLHIVMACPEAAPFAKTGGLADMVSSLAVALEKSGHTVTMIMPAYRQVLRSRLPIQETGIRISVPVGGRTEEGALLHTRLGRDISVYFVRADRYFDRDHLYSLPEGDYEDNAQRFVFFARAVLEVLRTIDGADILHAHDWQAALAITFLKVQPEIYPELGFVRTILTVHNLGYQGRFNADKYKILGLDGSLFNPRHFEFYGDVNFLKSGLVFADAVTTVSPTYAEEIRTSEFGFGLEGVLQERAAETVGILNGADYEVWSPATDPLIAKNYSREDVGGKRVCKADLQRRLGLAERPEVPLIGMVSRLAAQKGFDLLQEVVDALLSRDLQFILLGTGDRQYQEFLESAAERHRGKARVRIAFEDALAHRIEAGADMFLMPSRYEPGGLNQLYSMKYGTIPIVRATGGLKDSVEEFDPSSGKGTGFLFERYTGSALLAAVDRALAVYHRKEDWSRLMNNALCADYSWERSAAAYLSLYDKLLAGQELAMAH